MPDGTSGADCPICGRASVRAAFPFDTTWNGRTYRYLGCAQCETTFIDPVPSPAELASVYAWDNYHAKHYADLDLDRYEASLALLHERRPGARVLDVGCGGGGYLVAAQRAGFRSHGVEYEASTIEQAARRSGVPVTSLEAVEASGEQFDVIHLLDVLPHVTQPAVMLRRLEQRLAPGGIFCIEGPLENNASLVYGVASSGKRLRRALGLDRPATIAPTMLMRLTERGQRWFFASLGYRPHYFEVFETGWPYYVAGRRLSSPGRVVKQAIGAAAIAISRLQPRGRRWGNRFLALLEPAGTAAGTGD